MKSLIACLLLGVACAVGAVPAQYKFRLIDVTTGLSDNQIRGLSMTPDGRVGIRTASILNLYDGASFEYFPYDKEQRYDWSYSRPTKEYYDSQDRVWMKELRYLLLLDLKTNAFNYDIQGELKTMGIDGRLKDLFVDDAKNFWFLTEDNTFSFYDVKAGKKKVVDRGDSDFTRRYGVPVELAQYKNFCWIVYSKGLVRCYDYTSSEFLFQDSHFEGRINEYTDRICLHPDSTGNLWLMYNNGVSFYNRTMREWTDVASISGISNFFTCMDMDREGNLWVGTSRSGLRHIDARTFQVTAVPDMVLADGGVIHNDIYTIMADRQGGLWVGTLFQGVCYYHPGMQKFPLVQTDPGNSYVTNESVRCFLEEDDGNILVGCARGLFRFHPDTRQVEQIFKDKISDLVMSLTRGRNGDVWVGTFFRGVYRIRGGKDCTHFLRNAGSSEQDVLQNTSRAFYEDSRGNCWISVNGGVGLLDTENGRVASMLADRHPEVGKYKLVHALCPMGEDCFAAVGDNGLFYYDTAKDKVTVPDAGKDKYYKPGIKYFGALADVRGLWWFATEDGIRVWDKKSQRAYLLAMAEGLPNNTVSAILEDNDGVIWASTLNGICKIEPVREENGGYRFAVVAFGVADGLQRGMFYEHAALKTHDGTLYFGGAHGFNYFNPKQMMPVEAASRPILTGLSIFNTPIKVGAEYRGHVILTASVNRMDGIELDHDENFITLEFSGLNYANPSHTYYKYRLKNYEDAWVETPALGLGRAVYTGLRPGKYEFEVYAANGDKVWSKEPARLGITVRPPFWATYYAYVVYILLAGGMVYFIFRLYIRREKEKLMAERRENARKQQEELEEMKLRFFTNVSHEFRTPLTLILTPLGTLIKQVPDEELKRKLSVIHRNAEKLLQLVNQLLDFRKLEMKGERLLLGMGDLVVFVCDTMETFRVLVKEKDIKLAFDSTEQTLYMNFDRDKIYKVVSNLLSNAVKFTPSGGSITVRVEHPVTRNGREYAAIVVSDTGCGMAEQEKERIFTRFYQTEGGHKASTGSGIGLHLVKGYVDMHGGEITVDSHPGEGSTFTVFLPTDLQPEGPQPVASKEEGKTEPVLGAEEEEEGGETADERKKLLIVEDSADFRSYLAQEFSADFNVVEAADGMEGEEMVHAEWPDLIISDLMMPKRDGIVFCQRLKNDIHTSHIPFILLTAKMSDDARLESYKAGADSYISKPFNFEILKARVQKLIEQREVRKEVFHKNIEITPSEITTTSLDEEFVKKAVAFVEQNIGNSDYSLEELSSDLGMSKTHLNRKLTLILNMKPLAFIRAIRLKRAAQLLAGSQYNVLEIAERVGFNTIKYFNRYFKEEFGMTPTQYREANKKERKMPGTP